MSVRPIKVLHLIDQYLPITQNWLFNLLSNTSSIEHYIWSNTTIANHQFNNDSFHFIENPSVDLENIKGTFSRRSPSGLLQYLKNQILLTLKPNNIEILKRHIEKENIDIIHAHFGNMGIQYLALADLPRVKMTVSFYGWDYDSLVYSAPKIKKKLQELFVKVDKIFCEGPYGLNSLVEKGCVKDKLALQRLGVVTKNHPRPTAIKPKNTLNLVQIASFTEKKGQIYSIQAMEKLLKNYPNITLTLIGNESQIGYKTRLEQYVHTNNLDYAIFFEKAIEYSELYTVLSRYDAFIQPSCHAENGDCEGGAPIAILDAQLAGLVVVTTNHCDILQLIPDGMQDFISPERDVNALVRNILRYYTMDSIEFEEYVTNGYTKVRNDFDIKQCANILENNYKKLLEEVC